MGKGQSAIEFMTYVSISAVVLASLYTVISEKRLETSQFGNMQKAENIGEYVSFQVEMAMVQGDGYSRVFSIPEQIGGRNYTVRMVNGSLYVEWGEDSVSMASKYRGELLSADTSNSNLLRVTNRGGDIELHEE